MSYRDDGSGEPALVLVHGFLCRADDWANQSNHFSANRRVITCELRGHSIDPGSASPHEPQALSVDLLSDDLARLVGDLGLEKPILVGHSMGCRIVVDCCRKMPGRIGGVVLVDGSQLGKNGDATLAELDARMSRIGYRSAIATLFDDMFLGKAPGWKKPIVDHALSIEETLGLALLRSIAVWDSVVMPSALSSLSIPVLAIQSTAMEGGGRRSLSPGELAPFQRLVLEHVPHAATLTIAGRSHFCIIDAADQVNGAIESFVVDVAPGADGNTGAS